MSEIGLLPEDVAPPVHSVVEKRREGPDLVTVVFMDGEFHEFRILAATHEACMQLKGDEVA